MVDVKEKNEQWFKKKVLDFWAGTNIVSATPIQSRTVPGIPDVYGDMFYDRDHYAQWFEFKRIKTSFINKAYLNGQYNLFTVPFRAGQQAWAAKHWAVTRHAVQCWCMFDDLAVWFPLREIRPSRQYGRNEVHICNNDVQEAVFGKKGWESVCAKAGWL